MKQFLAIFALLLSSLPALAQNDAATQADVIRPGDNLVLENIPPKAREPSLQIYFW